MNCFHYAVVLTTIAFSVAGTKAGQDKALVDYINPIIGASTSSQLGEGKTFPGPTTPFGLVQLSPDTITGGDNGPGYSWEHKTIEGFSLTHLSGVGWYGDLGNFLVMPTTGKLKAYALCRESVMGAKSSRTDLTAYEKNGFVPGSISWTLENAYFDYCAGRFAGALGHTNDASLLLKRSLNYQTIYDPTVGNMHAKNVDGSWTPWRGPTTGGQGCVESNPYQQGWFVPHYVQGLINLMGKDHFLSYLTEFFEKTQTNFLWNDYCNHANEPAHHAAYLFTYAGAPWLSQKWSRFIMDHAYGTGVNGICGNDDVGQMSAWYVLSTIGFYPVSPVDGVYVIGSPLFDQVTIHLDRRFYPGRKFTIIARDNSPQNIYIQSAKLNGMPLARAWLRHDEIVAGGTLEFQMGSMPNKNWGSMPAVAPPSLSRPVLTGTEE